MLQPQVDYLEDPEGRLSLTEVRAEAAARFQPLTSANLGYSSSTFWLRLSLARPRGSDPERLLELPHFDLDEVVLYAPGQAPVYAGLDHPLSQAICPHRFPVFPVHLPDTPEPFFLRVRSDSAVIVPLRLWEPADFVRHTQRSDLVQAMYHGALMVLMVYNLLIFMSLRERSFLLYSLFAGCMGLGMFALNGLMRQFYWPPELAWPSAIHLSLGPLTIAFALYFTQSFLHTRTTLPRLHRLIHWVAASSLAQAAAPWFGLSTQVLASALSSLNIVAASLIITAGILSWRAGNRSAQLFLLAWGILSLGAIVAALHSFGWVPSNPVTAYAMQLSSAVEMVLLSFALAERIRLERDAREVAQAELLNARQALVESLRQSEARLEKTVAARTAELNQSLQSERATLDRYVRFGALIAHEFRNPLATVKSQLALIEKERQHGRNHIEQRLSAIAAATHRLGKLFEEWLQSDRLRRPHLELSLTALPLAGWLEDVVDEFRDCHPAFPFELRLGAPLPDLWADEALLRGALNNLVDNAAKYADAGTTIVIDAKTEDGMIGIAVIDHGELIAPECREAIFADYHRAVPEGQPGGLGLGLGFVKRIVELHRGWIELKSDAREGTGFRLWLPGRAEDELGGAGHA